MDPNNIPVLPHVVIIQKYWISVIHIKWRLNYLFARFWFSCQLKIYPPTLVWGIVESEHFDLLKALEFYFRSQPAIILKFSKYPQICEDLLGRFAGWNSQIPKKSAKNRLKNAKSYGRSFEVLAGILIFSSIYRLGTKIVTGKKKQSDTKVKVLPDFA